MAKREKGLKTKKIPQATVTRLPIYLRYLKELMASGVDVVSSSDLAELAGGNGPQLRKDLSFLGEFGTRGVGYDVGLLATQIADFMGLKRARNVAIIGAGRIGTALVKYKGFVEKGFPILAVFDSDPNKIGLTVDGLKVRSLGDLKEALKSENIEICVIATPAPKAQEALDGFAEAGIKAVLNFAPVSLKVPEGVTLRQIDLAVEMQILSFLSELGA
ncbi:MAG: redox-sensing transcriptional repressor Rex [Actinomycetota bacterium]|nr:redox-sensing transcriptional repressor Rex [Actinomycetota bacterium]